MVQGVESVRAHLQIQSLVQFGALREREIEIRKSRPRDRVASQVAERDTSRCLVVKYARVFDMLVHRPISSL